MFNRDSTTFLIENISAEKICHRCRLGILRGVFWHLKRSVFCFDTRPLRFVVWLIDWLIDRLFDWCWITTNFLVKMSTKFGRTFCRDRKNRKSVMHKSTCSTIKTPLCSKNIGAVYRLKLCSLWSEMVTSCDVKQETLSILLVIKMFITFSFKYIQISFESLFSSGTINPKQTNKIQILNWMQSITWRQNSSISSHTHSVKVTACEDYTFSQ